MTQSARNWAPRYHCRVNRQPGCTYDNRMTAVCDIAGDLSSPYQFSMTQTAAYDIDSSVVDTCVNGDQCELPQMFQVGGGGGGGKGWRAVIAARWGTGCGGGGGAP